jgi:hypothetical protein
MLSRSDISQGAYLRLNTSRLGRPAGLVGMVYAVGTDQTGEWYFQLRYMNAPPGTRTRASSQWSLNLHEEDLAYFDQIASGDVHKFLRESEPPRKPKREELPLPASWRGNAHPNQLRLFDF